MADYGQRRAVTTAVAGRRAGLNRAVMMLTLIGYVVAIVHLARRWDLPPIGPGVALLLGLAVVIELVAKMLFGVQFRDALSEEHHLVTRRTAVAAAFVGTSVARLIPAGGALSPGAMAWGVRSEDDHAAGAAVRVTLTGYGGLLVITGTAIAVAVPVGRVPAPAEVAVVLAAALILIGSAVLFGSRWSDRAMAVLPSRLRRHFAPTAGPIAVTVYQLGLIAVRIVLEATVLWIVLRALGIGLDAGQALLVYGTVKVVAGLPATPGGLGLVEGGMIGLLTTMGFRPEAVLAPVLIYQILDYWFLALLGLVTASRISGRRFTAPVTEVG